MSPLALRTKILYGVGEFANSIKGALFGLFIFYFYTTVMGMPGSLVGLVSGIGLIWDALIDPYIGYASDRQSRRLGGRFGDRLGRHFGSRHTFMLAGALTLGVTFWAIFSPPLGMSMGILFAWFLLSTLLARLTHSIFIVPYYALGAELCSDYDERTRLTSIRGACGLLGAMGAATLSFFLFFPNGVAAETAQLSYANFSALGLTFGLAMSLAALVATLSTRSQGTGVQSGESKQGGIEQEQAIEPERGPSVMPHAPSFSSGWAIAFGSASFRRLFFSFTLIFLGNAINTSSALYFLTYYAKILDGALLGWLQAAFYAGALIGIVLWIRVAPSVEKRWLYLVTTVATALIMMGAYFFVGEGRYFGTGDARPLLVGAILSGITGSVFWMMPSSMLADVIDESALSTGRRQEGVFFGIFSMGQQLATGLSVIAAGILVDRFAHLVPGQTEQSALTAERLAMLYSLVPAAFLILGALFVLGYTLDRRRVAAIQRALAQEEHGELMPPSATSTAIANSEFVR